RRATAWIITEEGATLRRYVTGAKRAGPIPTPAVRGARSSDTAGMHPSRHELHEAVSACDASGNRHVRQTSGTCLAVEVRAPAVRRAIRTETAGMHVAGHYLDGTQAGRSDRDRVTHDARPEALVTILNTRCGSKLSVDGRPPAVQVATFRDATGVFAASSQACELGRDGDGCLGDNPVHARGQHRGPRRKRRDNSLPV